MTETDPHRIRIEPLAGGVRVRLGDTLLAESERALVLHEGSLPPRYYLPPEDVRLDRLHPSDTTSHCPFKGDATYWSTDGSDDVAWCYRSPIPQAERIAGRIAFYDEKTDIELWT